MDLENGNGKRVKQGFKAGKKGHSWYSRLSKVQKIILWLLSLLVLLAIALGVGLGVGLNNTSNNSNDDDDNNDNDS